MAVAQSNEVYLTATIPNRLGIFKWLQALQQNRHVLLSHCPIRITLADGNVKEGMKWHTTPFDVAREISEDLANNALVAKVNGVLWDMNRPLEDDSALQFFKIDDGEGRDTFCHSSAHICGQSLETEYGCKLCIGPCTTRGEGFYYDAFYGDLGLNDDHFKQIEAAALKDVGEKQPFERIEVTRDQALEIFSDNKFKVEIINDLPADKTIPMYRCGPLVDLCRGPHIPNTSFVKANACLMAIKAMSTYWRGQASAAYMQKVSILEGSGFGSILTERSFTSPLGLAWLVDNIDVPNQLGREMIESVSWSRLHSKNKEVIRHEIYMLASCSGNLRSVLPEHQRLYHTAVGRYKLGEHAQSRELVNLILQMRPDYGAALSLRKAISEKVVKYGRINFVISTLATGLLVGSIPASWANLSKIVFQIHVFLCNYILPPVKAKLSMFKDIVYVQLASSV